MLLVPPQNLLKRFGELTEPMAEEAHFLRLQAANLRKTRDLLLSRLLSAGDHASRLNRLQS